MRALDESSLSLDQSSYPSMAMSGAGSGGLPGASGLSTVWSGHPRFEAPAAGVASATGCIHEAPERKRIPTSTPRAAAETLPRYPARCRAERPGLKRSGSPGPGAL